MIQPKSAEERDEMTALGLLAADSLVQPAALFPGNGRPLTPIDKRAMKASEVLNEAYDYPRPSSFARGTSRSMSARSSRS